MSSGKFMSGVKRASRYTNIYSVLMILMMVMWMIEMILAIVAVSRINFGGDGWGLARIWCSLPIMVFLFVGMIGVYNNRFYRVANPVFLGVNIIMSIFLLLLMTGIFF